MNQANLAVARKQTRRRRAEYLKRYRPKSERERERERKRERGKNGEETKRKGSTRHARRPTIAAAMAAAVVVETSTGQEYLYPYCPGNETRTPSPLTTQMNVPVHTNSCTKGIAFNVGGSPLPTTTKIQNTNKRKEKKTTAENKPHDDDPFVSLRDFFVHLDPVSVHARLGWPLIGTYPIYSQPYPLFHSISHIQTTVLCLSTSSHFGICMHVCLYKMATHFLRYLPFV